MGQRTQPRRSKLADAPGRLAFAGASALVALALANATLYLLGTRLGALWYAYLRGPRPAGIVVHHSDTPTWHGAAELLANIARSHEERGFGRWFDGRSYHIGYHFIILPDGRVVPERPLWMPGAHCRGHNDMIGICLAGAFVRDAQGRLHHPTHAQMRALVDLSRHLMATYHIPLDKVYLHRDLGHTQCPGEGFPRAEFFQDLRRGKP